MENGVLIGVITTLTVGLIEISKYLAHYAMKRRNGPEPVAASLNIEQRQKLTEIHATVIKTYDIVSKTDKDSVPLCYFPRSHTEIYKVMADLQYKVIERLAEITSEQKRIADLLDRIERRLDVV